MDHLFIALVLCSALLHAVWNAFLHVSEDRLAQLGTMSLPYLAFGIAGAWLLPTPERAAWPYVAASAALEVAYCFTLARAYRSGEFGQIYPIARGLSPLLVSVLAFAALHERPTPFGFAGIVLGSVCRWNAHANARNRSQGKERGAPFGRAKQATSDAAMRAISGIPVEWIFNLGLPRERPLAMLCSLRIRPVFAASHASRAAVLVATHARSICKQTLVSFGIMSLALRRGLKFSGESVPYALLTGVFIAAYSICDGIGARVAGSALGYVAWVYLLWSVPQILLVCAVRGGPRSVFGSRDAVRHGVVAGTISLVAYGIVVLAYRHLPVATVSALRETSSIFAVAIGWFAMRERPGPQRLVACALVVAGAALIRL
ncbi:hypothetical protein CJO71_18755 [Burkholderia ubonensis]|uniref:EamA family transporter n=1 Tax=Burkholderia ubonensis TaxID=101571 RepID=A0AB74CZ28_9BURK|nr:DMT family transporter [Burkholderia ubonensis]PAJ79337.1 hypothetical protein CJO71_18755 [Burkholderia ubonensis]PAJ99770.1 hypothetical protein CJO68_17730 [Burkholderia ubonensis]RQP71339.1 EamA family transporter [Burkholderia ubonensis]RQP88441.1 EamA family transporter [Burkholderia ubonensis]